MSHSDGGQCLKVSLIASLAICIALTGEIFFLNLNFFFSRGHLKLITSARLLYKRGLCGCDYRVWSVRRRLSWHGEGEGPVHMNLVNSRALPAAIRSVWVCSAYYGR